MSGSGNPYREVAELVTDIAGIEDGGRSAEAITRLMRKGRDTGYHSLTQADFESLQDAFDDANGRPRRKRQNSTTWKIKHWWYWHVSSPVTTATYAIAAAPRILRERFAGGGYLVFYPYRDDDDRLYIGETAWDAEHGELRELCAQLPWSHRLARRLGRLTAAWSWECPDCQAEHALPGLPSEPEASRSLDRHVLDLHDGDAPEACTITRIFWIGRHRY